MTDVICISSSDDEEDSSKQPSFVYHKRKLSTNSNDESRSKRHKSKDTNEYSIDSKKSNINQTSTYPVNHDKFDSKHSIIECVSSKPVSPKQHDVIHESYSSQSNISSNTSQRSSPVKKVIKPQLVIREKIPIPEPSENVFIKFLETCEQKKNSEDTKKILKSLKKRYDKLNSKDKDDEEFQIFLSNSLQKVSNDHNDKFYAYIQEVKDEIKRRTDQPKISISSKTKLKTNIEQDITEEAEDKPEIQISEGDMKKVKKLEKAIRQCQKRIKELEEKEVDFDEEEDSAYLQEDRYKRKLVELCDALSDIVGDRMLKKEIYKKQIRRKDITGEMTGISSVDEAIISFINSRIKQVNKLKHIKNPAAIADYLVVPDCPDILDCITKCNNERNLELTKAKREQLAKIAFKTIHSYLKKQRVKESEEYISSYIEVGTGADPATVDPDLNKRLQINKKEGDKKLNEIFKKYEEIEKGLSKEEMEKQSNQVSASEDESDHEYCINDKKKGSKNSSENKITTESDKDDESEKSIKSTESKKTENNESQKLENKNITENCVNNSKSEQNKKSKGEIEKCINESDYKNEMKSLDNKAIADEKNINSTVQISKDNITNISSTSKAKKENDQSEKSNITPLDVDDDEIQILSDNSDSSTKSKSNNKSVIENKERHTILRNTDYSSVNGTSNGLEKEETNCAKIDVSKDNNDNVQVISLSTEDCNIKCNESISTSNNFVNNDDKMDNGEIILENILSNESSIKNIEIMEINDDIEVLPSDDDKINNTPEVLETIEDNNSTNFLIKVCSFAKPPESWKDSLSPEKAKKQMRVPIQQALQDLSKSQYNTLNKEKDKDLPCSGTRFDNPLATNKNNAQIKNGSLATNSVQDPKIVLQNNISNATNRSITIQKILPNNYRTDNQKCRSLYENTTRNPTLPS